MDILMERLQSALQGQALEALLACNTVTVHFGLELSETDAAELLAGRKTALREQQRVEFGQGVLPKLIVAFCSSSYLQQDDFVETLLALQEIFYLYKNEALDELGDDELIAFMRQQFESVCFGDLDYLAGTCLERFSRAVRSGAAQEVTRRVRDEYALREVRNDYSAFDEETRWEYELYWAKLKDLF